MVLHNIFNVLPDNLESEVFDTLVQSPNVRIERIVSKGHATPPGEWYDQEQHEWIMVLCGEAIISQDNDVEHHLVAGSYLNIPAHTRHRVKWTLPDTETIWIAVHYQSMKQAHQ